MNTTDPRDMTWEEIRSGLQGAREEIWNWLFKSGPSTTTAIADGTGIGLLTVRPRVSELAVLGFVKCTGRMKREGIYQAVPVTEVAANHHRTAAPRQTFLQL
ncbi:MAG: hypothetical protein ABIS50_15290 [Luteolibacter sp.]|uniref:hypothetical protein n=1 Tax=Luteolibacter sp. TaxID=1962973 RepID=UPI003265B85F